MPRPSSPASETRHAAAIEIVDVAPGEGIRRQRTLLATKLKQEIVERIWTSGAAGVEVAAMVDVEGYDDAEILLGRLDDARSTAEPGSEAATATNRSFLQIETANDGARAARIAWTTPRVGLALTAGSNRRLHGRERDETISAIEALHQAGHPVWIVLEAAFGCPIEGPVSANDLVSEVARWLRAGVVGMTLADTGALADPGQIAETLPQVLATAGPKVPLALRPYNARGLGLTNALAAMYAGCVRFETSAGGLGDSPYEPGAPGIVATEDLVHLAETLGIATGVDLGAAIRTGRRLEEYLGQSLPARMLYVEPRSTLYRRLAVE